MLSQLLEAILECLCSYGSLLGDNRQSGHPCMAWHDVLTSPLMHLQIK
jgi:hypothetical protein